MPKVAFTRSYAISVLKDLDDCCGADPRDFAAVTNEELESELCLSGSVHDADMGGVFDTIPAGMQDAEANARVTGIPVTPV